MSIESFWRRGARVAVCLGLAVLLTSCLFAPGKFTSQLDLRKDGRFTFTYQGELYLLALTRASEMSKKPEFAAEPCHDEDYNERDCTSDELDQQRAEWDEQLKSKQAEDKRNAEMAQSLLGGIDPSDPKAAQEIADRLNRQKGWNNVTYKGNGLFAVEYAITSTISHDFVFPVFEGFPIANSFVTVTVREGNVVRVEAPGFSTQGSGNPMQGRMAGLAGGLGSPSPSTDGTDADAGNAAQTPQMDGTFRITTDGAILTNNTDEGPAAGANGQQLDWKINARTASPPVALIRLGN